MRSILLSLVIASGLLAADTAPPVPRKAQEFVFALPDGSKKLLSSYRGKVIVFQGLYTTCPHCAQTSQVLSRLQTEYGPKGLQVLGAAFDDGADVKAYAAANKVNFPVGFSQRNPMLVFLGYGPDARLSVPQMIFIDRKGEIRAQSQPLYDSQSNTEPYMRKMIEQLLAENAGTVKTSAKKK
jgi:peroxiredoxin